MKLQNFMPGALVKHKYVDTESRKINHGIRALIKGGLTCSRSQKNFLDIHYVRNEYIIFIFLYIFLREAFRESTPLYSRTVWAYLKF